MGFVMNYCIKNILVFVLLIFFASFPLSFTYAQFSCIPTCNEIDGRFMVLSGPGLSTVNNTDAFFHFTSTAANTDIEIGIFDGNAEPRWDNGDAPYTQLEFTLFFDPDGNGTGIGNGVVYRTWTSDGSSGDNMGVPMPDNDWFNEVLPNDPQAETAIGSFSYVLRVVNVTPAIEALNVFKLRTDGIVSIPPGEAFNYIANIGSILDLETVYPNIDLTDPACLNPAPIAMGGFGIRAFCDNQDPACCLFETTYDGIWDFTFDVPDGLTTLDIWDGDFDFGSASANADATVCVFPDGVDLDTDDPNTPIPLPPWAIGTDAITQSASVPTSPPDDDACTPTFYRPPSVVYELVDPDGVSYLNVNPSGNIEWELFNLSIEPFDPMLYDIHVDEILGGTWLARTIGNDLQNLNSMRVPFAVCAVDIDGNSFCPTVVLDVTIEGNGDGGVVSTNPGIDCSSIGNDDCLEIYDINTPVTLTATPEQGSIFVGWSGDPACIGPDPLDPILMLIMDMDISCIATFVLSEFVLNPIFPALDDNINSLSAENATPDGNVAFTWGKVPGSFTLGGNICSGIELGIANPRLLTIERANEFGVATHIFYIPFFSDFEFSIQLQAIDIETCRVSNQIEQFIRKDDDGAQGP